METMMNAFTGLVIKTATPHLINFVQRNWGYLLLYFSIYLKCLRNQRIRVSISYLYKIKVNNRYLLIKGNRIEQYQPVGGVYKILNGLPTSLKDLGVEFDHKMGQDDSSHLDLRISIKGKSLISLIKWFEAGKEREIDCHREFIEELVKPNFLSSTNFSHVSSNIDRIKQIHTGIRYSEHLQTYEYLIADIIELNPNEKQKSELLRIQNEGLHADKLIWVNESLINSRGFDTNQSKVIFNISEHSKWIT